MEALLIYLSLVGPLIVILIISNKFYKMKQSINENPLVTINGWKKTHDVTNSEIRNYPRFTILKGDISSGELLFDSSDYEVVNKSFGNLNYSTLDAGHYIVQDIKPEEEIKFKGETYKVLDVNINFLQSFQNYTTPISGHTSIRTTSIYEGGHTPHNIQIIITVA